MSSLSDESISLIILLWFLVLNGSCGHHFFHIKTRSCAEHSRIASEHGAIQEIFKSLSNKTRFLAFVCQTFYQDEQSDPSICSTTFYLGGG